MFSQHSLLAVLLLLLHITCVISKSALHNHHTLHSRPRDINDALSRTALHALLFHSIAERDDEASTTVDKSASISGTADGPDSSGMNNVVNTACITALAALKTFNSDAGLGGCYNLMSLNMTNGHFQADLRLYQISEPSGAFAGISINNMLVNLHSDFAQFAEVSLNSKAKRSELEERQTSNSTFTEVLEGLWEGQIESLDYSRLTTDDFMALVIPEFEIRAIQPTTHTPVSSQLNTQSAVYFVSGTFAGATEQQALAATNPDAAPAAAAKASVFVMPGTHLGIFPAGLIVTGTWAFLFVMTFGLGTFWRIKHRSLYRSRLAALGRIRSL